MTGSIVGSGLWAKIFRQLGRMEGLVAEHRTSQHYVEFLSRIQLKPQYGWHECHYFW